MLGKPPVAGRIAECHGLDSVEQKAVFVSKSK
jgi:hypothetical protein